jgi:NAD(P)-dependent dehydrogenase (short-subunit alcohol dehydrogenase family)
MANFAVQKLKQITMTFQNKKIIVAGGTSGIGLAAAKLFTHAGASVTVTGRDAEKLKAAEQAGLQTAQTDSTDRAALDAFFKTHGAADHLVIALGSTKGLGNFAELSLENLREGFEEKYWSHLNTLKAALPFLNDKSSITLITAITGTGKIPGTSGIGAINGALEIMVSILAKELKPLRVNAISPGVVDTPWWNFLPEDTKQETFAQYAAQIAVGRIANPDDIADAILFVAENEYMTGQIIGCDGGLV